MADSGDSFHPTRRQLLQCAGAGLTAAALASLAACTMGAARPGHQAGPNKLRLIGHATLAHRLSFKGSTVGGLSGLDYDPAKDLWYALCDDRSDINPARFYTFKLPISTDRVASPELWDVVTLTQADGRPFPGRRRGPGGAALTSTSTSADIPDPEAIRYRAVSNTLWWTSEGDVARGLAPSVREASLAGRTLRSLPLPAMFAVDPTGRIGPRDNLAFEGLALTPDGNQAWVSMEAALLQDGPVPTVAAPGGPCRITLFDLADPANGRALRQRAYIPDPIPQASMPPGAYADNGISEILMLDAHRMLVLERAYMTGVGNSLRLYCVDTREGSDTLDQAVLRTGQYQPMAKTLVADFSSFGLPRLDNTEGMAWGPSLPARPGMAATRTLVFVSDDNFNPLQVTQFVAFEFLDTPA